MHMMEHLDLLLRWILGVQLTFWGLNGFFHWRAIPPSPPAIDRFVSACYESRFIMATVKLFEIIFGIFLLLNFAVPMALGVLTPIIFVVSGLHIVHSHPKKSWEVLFPITLPFLALIGLRRDLLYEVCIKLI